MNAVAAPSPRQITWQRRRRALAAAWRDFRQHRPGMVGPCDPHAHRADGAGRAAARGRVGPARDQHDGEPGVGESVGFLAARHGQLRPQRHDPVHLRGPHQPAGRARGDRAGDGDRLGDRHRRRLHGRHRRLDPDAGDRVVPRDPVPAARDRAGGDPRARRSRTSSSSSASPRGRERARNLRAGADPEGARLRRPQPCAWCLQLAPHDAPRGAERRAADPRHDDADRTRW